MSARRVKSLLAVHLDENVKNQRHIMLHLDVWEQSGCLNLSLLTEEKNWTFATFLDMWACHISPATTCEEKHFHTGINTYYRLKIILFSSESLQSNGSNSLRLGKFWMERNMVFIGCLVSRKTVNCAELCSTIICALVFSLSPLPLGFISHAVSMITGAHPSSLSLIFLLIAP